MAKIKGNEILNGVMWGVLLHVGISVVLPQLKNANLSNLFNFGSVAAEPAPAPAPAPAPTEDTTEEEPLEDDTGDQMGIDDTLEEEPAATDGEGEDPTAAGVFGTSGWSRDRFGGGSGSTTITTTRRRGMIAIRIGGL